MTDGVCRRRVLAALGAGLVATSGFSPTARAERTTTVAVPELLAGRSVVTAMDLPEQWLTHRTTARAAKRTLLAQLRGRGDVFSVGLVGQSESFGGKPGLQLRVQVTSQAAMGDLPTTVEGIPVRVERAPARHGPADCFNSKPAETAAGGQAVGRENHEWGTATAAVTNEESGASQLLHCAHVFYSDCQDANQNGIEGRTAVRGVYPDEQTRIGTVTAADRKGDYVLISADDDSQFESHIDDGETNPTIRGSVSAAKLDSLAAGSDDETIHQMGVTTGLTTGTILSTALSFTLPDACYNFRGGGVEASTNFADGDSGGPVYLTRNDGADAYLSHLASYRYWDRAGIETCHSNTVQRGNAVGTAAHFIEEHESITIG